MDQSRGFYYLISEEKPDKNNIRVIDYRPVSPYYLALNDKTKNNPILVIGDGFPVFKWNILELIDAKNNRLVKENKILERDNKIIKDLKLRLEKHEQLIEELYKAFENLNNTLKEKDKSIHRLNIKIKQLSFELEQMRSRFADRKFKQEENKNVSIQKKDQSTDQCKSYVIREVGEEEIKIFDDIAGSQEDREEINLGKVSIIINPKNESL
jgi:seryl-tRNA synthetase